MANALAGGNHQFYIAGWTESTDLLGRPGQVQATNHGRRDAFVLRFSPMNTEFSPVEYFSYLGGTGQDLAYGVAVDASSRIIVTGSTRSADFPIENASQPTYGGGTGYFGDGFVAVLEGSDLVSSTYVGGSGSDACFGVAQNSTGEVYITGMTASADFPVINGLQAAVQGESDAFLIKLNLANSPPQVVYATPIGGSGQEQATQVIAANSGAIYLSGRTNSVDFGDRTQVESPGGNWDVAVIKLNEVNVGTQPTLVTAVVFGGTEADTGESIALGTAGTVVVTGVTQSADFVTANAIQPATGGNQDAFIVKLRLCAEVALQPATLPVGTVNEPYSQVLTAEGGIAPYRFEVTEGSLPGGFSLNPDGSLLGTFQGTESTTFTVTATDAEGCQGTRVYTLSGRECLALQLSPDYLIEGLVNQPYQVELKITEPVGTYHFTVVNGVLPAGVTLSSEGVVSGTPTETGSYSIQVELTEVEGCQYRISLTLTVLDCNRLTITPATLPVGKVGVAYQRVLSGEGGTGANFFTLYASQLPDGLTLSESGEISGIPTTPGTTSVTVVVHDEGGCVGSQNYLLEIIDPTSGCETTAIAITPNELVSGQVGNGYSQILSASGGQMPYAFTISSGTLPAGLILSDTGSLTGTPTSAGTATFTVVAGDANGCIGRQTYSLTIDEVCAGRTISLTPTTLPEGTQGTAYSETLSAAGGQSPYTFTVSSGVLPNGFSLNPTGELTAASPLAGTASFTVTATDARGCIGSQSYTLTVADPCAGVSLVVTPAQLAEGRVGAGYTQILTAQGGTAPYSFTATSSLPAGLSLSPTGILTGTPETAGSFNLTVEVTDATGCAGSQVVPLTILPACPALSITPTTLAEGRVGVSFNQTLTASGGTAPYTFQVTTGSLPSGLTLSESGSLTGTPTTAGTASFTLTVTDASGCRGTQTYTMEIKEVCDGVTINLTPTTLPEGTQGTAYSQTLSASGGQAPYTFTVSTGTLPNGFSLNPTGELTATAPLAGTASFTVTVTDARGCVGSQAYTLTVVDPCAGVSLVVTPAQLAEGRVGVGYTQTLTAQDGNAPYSFAISNGVPAGLNLSATGVLTGTPETAGSFNLTVEVTDATGCAGSQVIPLRILPACPALSITPATLAEGRVGVSFNQTLTATGGASPYTFTVSSGVPAGLNLSATGILTGTPETAGSFNLTVEVTDATGCAGSQVVPLTILPACPALSITPATLTSGLVGIGYAQTITASGGTAPYTFQVTAGTLPSGLTLASTGILTGIPEANGSTTFTVTVQDAAGCQGSQIQTLTIGNCPTLSVVPSELPAGSEGTPYAVALSTAGGVTPVTFSVIGGVLPTGIILASDGVLAGTTTASGSFTLTVKMVDASGCQGTQSLILTIGTCPPIAVQPSSLPAGTVDVSYTQQLEATGGTAPHQFSLVTGSLPAGLTLSETGLVSGLPVGTGSTTFTVEVTDAGGCRGQRQYTLTIGTCTPLSFLPPMLPPGLVNEAYDQLVTVTGATGPVTVELVSGTLPAGLELTPAGRIVGTPTTAETATLGLKATDGTGCTGIQTFTLRIKPVCSTQTIEVTPTTLPAGKLGVGYDQTLSVTGGQSPYAVTLSSGSLPAGLVLNPTGRLTGTPTSVGTATFTLLVTDADGCTTARSYTLVVEEVCAGVTITVTPASLPAGIQGTAYSQTLSATGGQAPYTFTISSGTLPAGLILSETGSLTGTPTTVETASFTITATDASGCVGSQSYNLTVGDPCAGVNIVLTPAQVAGGRVGSVYSQAITARNGVEPYTFTLSAGTLPPGIGLSSTGVLTGTPGVAGDFPITILATDASGCRGSRSYTLRIVEICAGVTIGLSPETLPVAVAGSGYSQPVTATGGQTPYTFAITSGGLPAGLTLNPNGTLSGTPATAGTASFSITATDGNGCTGVRSYSITVSAPANITIQPETIPGGTVGVPYSQSLTATGGTGPYAFTVTGGSLPPGLTLSTTGIISGTPTSAGEFTVTVTATDATGATGTRTYTSVRYGDAIIRHAPTLNGRLEGSLQMLLGESLTLNGGAVVTGKLLVPGTPTVRTNGNPTFGGVIVGTGSTQPSNYTVTLNGNATLGNLVNRMDPLALPTVANPPNPTGTRDVTINQASQSIGDPATLRNLTLNGNVGMKAVPPGTYGTFIANGGSGFIFGVAGSTQPTVYNLQNLNLNGNSQIQIVGPVVLTLRNGTSINSSMGNTTNPQWLQLRIATNGFTLNGGSSFYGAVLAPNGTVIVNGNSTLRGSVAADRLTINGGGLLRPLN